MSVPCRSAEQFVDRVAPPIRALAAALEADAVLEGLRRCGAQLLDGASPRRCYVDRVHPGSRHGFVVEYVVDVDDSDDGPRRIRLFGQLPAAGMSVSAMATAASARLARHTQSATAEAAPFAVIGRPAMLVWRVGSDDRIDGLMPKLGQHNAMLAAVLGEKCEDVTLLAHRFNKRAVLSISGRDGGGASILKLYRRKSTQCYNSAMLQSKLADMVATCKNLRIPRVITRVDRLSGFLMERAQGLPPSVRKGADRCDAMALAGRALGELHDCQLSNLAAHGPSEEMVLLRLWVSLIRDLDSRHGAALERALSKLEAEFRHAKHASGIVIHRDFHERQLLTDANIATLIDFDTVRVGDPGQDIGNFLAHLRWAERISATSEDQPAEAFLDGYLEQQEARFSGDQKCSISLHARATQLRLSIINWFSDERRDTALQSLQGV